VFLAIVDFGFWSKIPMSSIPVLVIAEEQENRRFDPMLGWAVTYSEMCHGLGDQQLSETELKSHWANLHLADKLYSPEDATRGCPEDAMDSLMSVTVKKMSGGALQLQVTSAVTIDMLRKKVASVWGWDPECVALCAGTQEPRAELKVLDVGLDFTAVAMTVPPPPFHDELPEAVSPETYASCLEVARAYARHGVEGLRFGTILAIGSVSAILNFSTVPGGNPFSSPDVHGITALTADGRNVLRQALNRDGLIIINGTDGVVHAAEARILGTSVRPHVGGCRHGAAMWLAEQCPDCLVIKISENTDNHFSVFKDANEEPCYAGSQGLPHPE